MFKDDICLTAYSSSTFTHLRRLHVNRAQKYICTCCFFLSISCFRTQMRKEIIESISTLEIKKYYALSAHIEIEIKK